jgi:serine/threonine-protein kinase
VPTLTGLTADAATAQLDSIGLVGEVTEQFDNTGAVPAGTVISQTEAPGATAARGDTIHYVVSKGQDLVTVDNVLGFSRDEAISELTSHGFTVSIQGYRPDRIVVSMSVAPGTKLLRGSDVGLIFGDGAGNGSGNPNR